MGFTYQECMNLPVWQRRWFIDRMIQEIKSVNGEQTRGAHQNDPHSRALRGLNRDNVPAKLRRFT